MKKNILCPTDFTGNSEIAIKYARLVAQAIHADITIFHAAYIPVSSTDDVELSDEEKKYLKEENIGKKQIEKLIKSLEKEDKGGTNIQYNFLCEDGLPIPAIRKLVKEKQVDLIVMATAGDQREKFQGIFLESNAAAIIEDVDCPVLVVPLQGENNSPKEIVYALDIQHFKVDTVNKAIDILKAFTPNITFVYVTEEIDSKTEKRFQEAKTALLDKAKYENTQFELFTSSNLLKGLNEFAYSKKADLIVMATYKRGVLEKFYDRSLSKKMVYQLKTPVMFMHTHKK